MRKPWTGAEDAIVRLTYPSGGRSAAFDALTAAGYERSQNAISVRANALGVTQQTNRASGGSMPSLRPHYRPEIARQLAALAQSNPSPKRYAEAKARILGRST